MIALQTVEPQTGTMTVQRARRWVPGSCVWCGEPDAVQMYRNEPRCATCIASESVINEAKGFIGMYGLRPLGGTLQSDDDEEREYRVNAREARTALNQIRLAKLPDPTVVRKALRPRAASVVAGSLTAESQSGNSGPRRAARTAAAKKVDPTDLVALGNRVTGLLDQLSAVDIQITAVEGVQGLPARARRSDLDNQRTRILSTLAALEKVRRSGGH